MSDIVSRVNRKLAGETLVMTQMIDCLDDVIDDINTQLNSTFPSFTELYGTTVTDYNYFPDKYIRKVVVTGAAWYFYTLDEEGEAVATQFQADYQKFLFYMVRDYSSQIPELYRADNTGHITFEQETVSGERGVEIDNGYFQL